MLVRQAHPGGAAPPYVDESQKLQDGERYARDEAVPWPVLVDDLRGTVHQVYGGLADPTYLLDVDGRVAFYDFWTSVPTLHRAVQALLAQGGRGVVLGGWHRRPHPLAAIVDGWRGLRRGLPTSYLDLELAAPGSPELIWLGSRLRPLIAPLTLRAEPLSGPARLALGAGFVGGLTLLARGLLRRR